MKPIARYVLPLVGLMTIGAVSNAQPTRAAHERFGRPASVARFGPVLPNAIRRARLAHRLPKHRPASLAQDTARRVGGTASTSYSVTNLNTLLAPSHVTIVPLALNNAGQIVGNSSETDSQGDSFGYLANRSGTGETLAHSAADGDVTFVDFPTAISNDGRTVVGIEDYTIETYDSTTTGTLPLYWQIVNATSSVEQVSLASSYFPSTSNRITLADGSAFIDNRTLKSTALDLSSCRISDIRANAVNDSGIIAGYSKDEHIATVLTLGACPTAIPNVPVNSFVDAIASNGDLLVYTSEGGNVPMLWAKGRLYPIPLPSGFDATTYHVDAVGLNSSGVVVGNILAKDATTVGTFYYANGTSVDLQTLFPAKSGWSPVIVAGINDGGEIIGQGYLDNVLTPFALNH